MSPTKIFSNSKIQQQSHFQDLKILSINNHRPMGGICTGKETEKETTQCPHRKPSKQIKKPYPISQNIAEPEICPLCKQIKELENLGKDPEAQTREHLSLATQNQEQDIEYPSIKKSTKNSKKTIKDFQVVRGLGKGAFGRVYMIKERDDYLPLTAEQDILSLKIGEDELQQNQLPEDIQFEMKIETQNGVDIVKQQPTRTSRRVSKLNNAEEDRKSVARSQNQKSSKLPPSILSAPRYYALKIIPKNVITSSKQKKQAMSERYILQAMDHPFIVKLHYAFQTKSRLFLIVDLLPGGELFYLLRKMKRFQENIAKFYAAEILLAISYLHERSIIYRDLKPENILLDTEGHARITDFGLSKVMYSSNQKTYSLCGTPQYMAPEVIKGLGYTQAADWFSFGSLIYDMLTGRPPFLNNNKNVMMKNLCTKQVPLPYYLSESAKSLLTGLFQIEPEKRLGFKQGAAQIKKHKFFKDIDFDLLIQKKIEPPISFLDDMKDFLNGNGEVFVNSGGFEKWSSWHMNIESPEGRKTKQSKQQYFEGFTFEPEEYELHQQEHDQEPKKEELPKLQ